MSNRVLLIDDSKTSLAYYKDVLAKYDIECDGTTSASEGIQKAIDNNYNCVITDYEMPEMTGTEVVRLLKEAFQDNVLPIIVLTSRQSEQLIEQCLENGADNYILKNEEPYSIALKIKNAVKLGHLQKELIQNKQTQSIKEMITTYNHEFNNALAILKMDIKIYAKKYHDNDLSKLESILKTTDRLVNLVDEINKFESYDNETYIDGVDMVKIGTKED